MKILRILLVIVLVVVSGRAFNANAQTKTNLYSFGNFPNDGNQPLAGLVQGSDGNFYGTTGYGGMNGTGTVFRISPSGNYTNLYSFIGSPNDGSSPWAGLVQGNDSNFYGTTYAGGLNGNGTVFQISPSGNYTNLYSFVGSPNDGSRPWAGLVQGSDSNFYGTTGYGGLNDNGIVFQISPSGCYTNLYSFAGYPDDGREPNGLVQGSDGNFYGTTYDGGTNDNGIVFQINPSGCYTNLYSFAGSPNDGAHPEAGLVQGSDSNFYGTTWLGGTNDYGTVFRISPSGSYTNLYSFAGYPNDGREPNGLVQGSDGNFYGTTWLGGMNDGGTVFRISPSGSYTNLLSFGNSPNDGNQPLAGLVRGSESSFYGTTYSGGVSNAGTVFLLFNVNCTFSISLTNETFAPAGGFGSVSVITSNSCIWTATRNDGFITITGGSSGAGTGTVSYTVAANPDTAARRGTMTIAGQTFTVDQIGAPVVTFSFSNVVQSCKTKMKIDKKTMTTNTTTTCTVRYNLVVSNTGLTNSPKFSVLLWPEQGSTFDPDVSSLPLTKKVKALKKDKSVTIKMKGKFNGDQAGTFIFATDTNQTVLASVEVPTPE